MELATLSPPRSPGVDSSCSPLDACTLTTSSVALSPVAKRPLEEVPCIAAIRRLHYNRLTVGDPKQDDLATLSEHDDSLFQEAWLDIGGAHNSYKVKFAVIRGTTYLKTVEPYCSYEFEQIFNFESNCANFAQDKVVVVRPSSS